MAMFVSCGQVVAVVEVVESGGCLLPDSFLRGWRLPSFSSTPSVLKNHQHHCQHKMYRISLRFAIISSFSSSSSSPSPSPSSPSSITVSMKSITCERAGVSSQSSEEAAVPGLPFLNFGLHRPSGGQTWQWRIHHFQGDCRGFSHWKTSIDGDSPLPCLRPRVDQRLDQHPGLPAELHSSSRHRQPPVYKFRGAPVTMTGEKTSATLQVLNDYAKRAINILHTHIYKYIYECTTHTHTHTHTYTCTYTYTCTDTDTYTYTYTQIDR